jgi:hypothetical protein
MAIFQILTQSKSAPLERMAGGDDTRENIAEQYLGIELWGRAGDVQNEMTNSNA